MNRGNRGNKTMATYAEILNTLVKQMNSRGYLLNLSSQADLELAKIDKFFDGILKIHFGETGEPE
jgi:hypothetical protein